MSRRLWWLTFVGFAVGFMFAWIMFSRAAPLSRLHVPDARQSMNGTNTANRAGEASGSELGRANAATGPAEPAQSPDVPSGNPADSECKELYGRFVGLHEDRVAVFAGHPDGCRTLLGLQPWNAEQLLPFQREDVGRGIVFSHDDELFQILEGLAAP